MLKSSGLPLIVASTLLAVACRSLTEPPPPASSKLRIRLHSAHVFTEETYATDNLVVASLDRLAAGYQRLGQGMSGGVREVFGLQFPLSSIAPAARHWDVSGHAYRAPSGDQRELVLAYRPSGKVELLGRWFDLPRGEGGAMMAHFRRNASLLAPDNMGAGGFVASGSGRRYGVYGWTRVQRWNGFFIGAGRYLDDSRYVVGLPNAGGLAVRYLGLRTPSGFAVNEVLFSDAAANLTPIDFYSPLVPIKGTDALITTGGVFGYQIPPISSRGRGIIFGLAHRKIPFRGDFLDAEAVVYRGRAFTGIRYSGRWNEVDTATIGVPIGYQFREGDGLTRNFFRVVPSYDRAQQTATVVALLEWRN